MFFYPANDAVEGSAYIVFEKKDATERATKRMDGKKLFGNMLKVRAVQLSPQKELKEVFPVDVPADVLRKSQMQLEDVRPARQTSDVPVSAVKADDFMLAAPRLCRTCGGAGHLAKTCSLQPHAATAVPLQAVVSPSQTAC